MKILFACLADHASADQFGNKLSVGGIFDHIVARQFPAMHMRMYLVFRLLLEHEDNEKQHNVTIALRDADHREYQRLEAQVQTGSVAPGDFLTLNQIIELNGVTFARPGRYHFGLTPDKEAEVRVPFSVVEHPA